MRIKPRDIPGEGLDFSSSVKPRDIDLLEEFVDQDAPVKVEGRLERVNNFVLAQVSVTYTLDTVCARCLESIHRQITQPCALEIEFNPGDDSIDLGVLVREEILIGYVSRALCQEDCKGICQSCGAYLNEEECECSKETNKE